MSTPAQAYPLSPTPASPPLPSAEDQRRRSKRDSTSRNSRDSAAAAAARYPSPPPSVVGMVGGNGPAPVRINRNSLEASLVIPPFNPNNRRVQSAQPQMQSPPQPHPPSHYHQMQQQPHLTQGMLVPSPPLPPLPFQAQREHRPASPNFAPNPPPPSHYSQNAPSNHRPTSAIAPVDFLAPSANATSAARGTRASVGYLPTTPTSNSSSYMGPYPALYTPHQLPRQKIFFGPYILLQTLGEGEFGKVKLGLHSERWGEEVAIKLIKRGNVDTVQRTEKVKREIEVLKSVRHPNIVRLYDVIETEKYIGIVLEYASGGELFDHILAHRYLKERDAARLFAQLISGVAYLHAKGIVHRDLKLENLLLDRNRNVQITDFGFANRFESATSDLMATSCGSPCYAAPELVVQEGKYVGTAVDVWSCGVILYAMLAGYLPYDDDPANPEGDNINLLYKYIINTPLTFPDWISAEPRNLLLKMLVPDPKDRCTLEDVKSHSWLSGPGKYDTLFAKTVPELENEAQESEMNKRRMLEAQRQWLVMQQQQQQQQAIAQAQMAAGAPGGRVLLNSNGQEMLRSQSNNADAAARHRSAVVPGYNQYQPTQQQHFQQQYYPSPPMSQQQYRSPPIVSPAHFPASVPEEQSSLTRPLPPTPVLPSVEYNSSATNSPASCLMTPSNSNPPIPSPTTLPAPNLAPTASTTEDHIMSEVSTILTNVVAGEKRRQDEELPVLPLATSTNSNPGTRSRRSSARGSTNSSNSINVNGAGLSDSERRKKSHRATVQVEYDGGDAKKGKGKPTKEKSNVGATKKEEDVVMVAADDEQETLITTPIEVDFPAEISIATLPPGPEPIPIPSTPSIIEEEFTASPPNDESMAVPRPPTLPDQLQFPSTPPAPSTPPKSNLNTPKKRKNSGSPPAPRATDSPVVPPKTSVAEIENVPTPLKLDETPAVNTPPPASPALAAAPPMHRAPSIASTVSVSRHKKGAMSTDRFSIRSLLPGSTTSLEKGNTVAAERAKAAEAKRVQESAAKQKALDEVTNRRKSRRQKALSLQPFRPSTSSKVAKALNADSTSIPAKEVPAPRTRASMSGSSKDPPGAMAPPPPRPSTAASSVTATGDSSRPISTRSSTAKSTDLEASWSSSQATGTPSGKAKAVMDWFRRRGSSRGSEAAPFTTDFDRHRPSSIRATNPSVSPSLASTSSQREGSTTPIATETATLSSSTMRRGPSVVVTASAPEEISPGEQSVPSSRSASGAQSDASHLSQTSTVATSVSAISTTMAPATPIAPSFSDSRLRVHTGALDKAAITSKSPPDVIVEIRNALWNMGLEIVQDGDYKLKCTRRSKKKSMALTGLGLSGSGQSNVSAGPATSSSVDRRTGLPSSPSISSTLTATSPATTLRSFFGRKGSATPVGSSPLQASTSAFPSPALSASGNDEFDILGSPLAPSSSVFTSPPQQPNPVYGDASSTDAGDEVRFSCEITRVRHLQGLYYLDCKRLKGGAWSYKFIYEQLLSRLALGDA